MAKKVEELNELRVEKLNRVKLVEKEKDELEGPLKDALGFLRMENEKVEKTFRQRSRYNNSSFYLNLVKLRFSILLGIY